MIRLNCRPSLGSCLAVAAAGFLSGRWASAATPAALDAVLTYDADAACPARDQFLALLDKAIDPPDASRAPAGPDVRLRVTIRAATGGYHGSLEKIDRSGSSEPRVVVSPVCAEVAQALALTAAFSLAPEAARNAAVVVERREPPGPAPRADPSGSAPAAWLLALGASGAGALSTGTLTGFEGSAGRAFPVGGTVLPFTVSVRLRTTYARNGWTGDSPVARFALWTGALEVCALPRSFWGGVEIGLCAHGESGWLRGRGVQIDTPRISDSVWLAFGGGPLVRVPLGGRWQIEARGAVVRPLRRVHFAFEAPTQPVADIPATTWIAALALAARFP